MIEYRKGNLLDAGPGSLIVHGCNCQGVMGSGVALAIKQKWPKAFDVYKEHEKDYGLWLGEFSFVVVDEVTIFNMYTQDEYGRDGRRYVDYDAVARGFEFLAKWPQAWRTKQICFPKIGAGLGGGNWEIISTIIDQTLPDAMNKVCFEL